MTTKSTMSLAELAEKGASADLLFDLIQHVAQRMMGMDAEVLVPSTVRGEKPGSSQQPQRLSRTAL